MAYVTRDGQVCESQPWGIGKIVGLFWAFIDLILAFFQTMLPREKPSSNNFRQSGGSRWSGGGGGGNGGGGGPRGPPKPPSRRNIRSMGDYLGPPPTTCGSCCG